MKTLNSLGKSKSASDALLPKTAIIERLAVVKEAVEAAQGALGDARQKCLIAGALLNEVKEELPHGDFEEWCRGNLPVKERTWQVWMRAAANVVKALPGMPRLQALYDKAIDIEAIPVSEMLTAPEDELPASALAWRQQWLDFTSERTLKECLDGVFVDGDEGHRVDRAINGKLKGGAGGDRKDFPLFVAVKLKDMGSHLAHWEGMSETQRTEVKLAVRAAVTGDGVRMKGRQRENFSFEAWPVEFCQAVLEAVRERVKGR